ncbi:MAG: sodium:proton antiporter, partial [Tardiphaga sp.]
MTAHAQLDGAALGVVWALPFAGILLSIATGPVLYPHLWERHTSKFAALWAALVIVPLYLFTDATVVTHTLAHTVLRDYLPFILLLLALYTVAGGLYVEGNLHDSAFT